MKIYANADLHGAVGEIDKIKNKEFDVAIFAGDMTIFGNGIDKVFSKIEKLKKTTLVIPGNHEEDKQVKQASSKYKHIFDIHKNHIVIDNILFLGHGGEGFTTRSEEFDSIAKRFEQLAEQYEKVVLVIHQPPYKTTVDIIHGQRAGNKSYRDFIKRVQPNLVICGHLHENANKQDKIGKSLIINPSYKGKFLEV